MIVFINKGFVEKHCLDTYKLSKVIPVYNINGISNEAS